MENRDTIWEIVTRFGKSWRD